MVTPDVIPIPVNVFSELHGAFTSIHLTAQFLEQPDFGEKERQAYIEILIRNTQKALELLKGAANYAN